MIKHFNYSLREGSFFFDEKADDTTITSVTTYIELYDRTVL